MKLRCSLIVCLLGLGCSGDDSDDDGAASTDAGTAQTADSGTASTDAGTMQTVDGGTASTDGGTTETADGGTASTDGGTASTDGGTASTDGGTASTDGGTASTGSGGGGMVDACLDLRDPGSCGGGPNCEWREGFQIEFDLGACGCAVTDRGLCVTAGSYKTVDGREAYVFDEDADTVVVLDGALEPVPEGVTICTAADGEYCACAVGEANYCDL